MGSNWPEGTDLFLEPSLPEDTPLSSAGSGNKSHVEHHRDLGDAVEALQDTVILRTHDHSGSTDDRFHGNKLLQINTHESVDTDTSEDAIHHTIGLGPNQAAAGNHVHEYVEVRNPPYIICTSTTRPASPWPGLQIWETDTNRARVWSVFPNNAVSAGIYSVDYFNRTSALNLGTTYWHQSYTLDPNTNGRWATPDGLTASWIDNSASTQTCIARRIYPTDRYTMTDDQVITWRIGGTAIEEEILFTEGATNDMFFRMSDDEQYYTRLRLGDDYLKLFYSETGLGGEKYLGEISNIDTGQANSEWRGQIVDRTFSLYRDGHYIGSIVDDKLAAPKGANFRGWGIGVQAGNRFFGQTTPANLDWVSIQDYTRYITVARWSLLPIGQVPVLTLTQKKKQTLYYSGTNLEWTTKVEDTFDMFDTRSPTDVIIREPGRYLIEVQMQWSPNLVPDVGHIWLVKNGVDTDIRDSSGLRGNLVQPGFSQTQLLSRRVRLTQGDIIRIKTSYGATGIITGILSWFDPPSNTISRLDISYIGP